MRYKVEVEEKRTERYPVGVVFAIPAILFAGVLGYCVATLNNMVYWWGALNNMVYWWGAVIAVLVLLILYHYCEKVEYESYVEIPTQSVEKRRRGRPKKEERK